MAHVLQAQPLGVPAQVGQFGQDGGVDGGGARAAQHRHGELGERADPAAQLVRQHLLQLGQRPHRALADALDALSGGGAQAHGDGDGLVVVQQQRREFGARAEPVAAAGAGAGVHRVAQFAQLVHVPADGARGDAEALGEVGAGPLAVGLEEGEQTQQTCRGLEHGGESGSPRGQVLSSVPGDGPGPVVTAGAVRAGRDGTGDDHRTPVNAARSSGVDRRRPVPAGRFDSVRRGA
ncbi:hypothetical protein GCM10018772_45440 [Streptomyces fumanus]|uniref:Uncharacterized protein n=1 Tax=Streptomyces fumanus TaxID=67302 RepID=A0A919AM58_9ACTN|nr:hypothetical protein GCM10018772_45440 [Streptomyces fumanus]